MNIHQTIKEEIKNALRARDTIKLDALRGLNALCLNELMSSNSKDEFLSDDKTLSMIKRSVKQRKDSIEQFTKGGREDLVAKEKGELKILESYLPSMMPLNEVKIIVKTRIDALKSGGNLDLKTTNMSAQIGKVIGMLMKEFAGRADGNDVKSAVEEILVKKP